MSGEQHTRVITPAELRVGLVRQRRSLIATSVALILFVGAGIELHDITLLGNRFDVARPALVPLAMWVLWAYFGLRYYQHYRDLRDPGPQSEFRARMGATMFARAQRELRKRVQQAYAESGKDFSGNLQIREQTSFGDPRGKWTVVIQAAAIDRVLGRHIEQTMFSDQTFEYKPSRTDRLRSWIWVATNTRYASEYLLPVIVALIPIGVWLASA